jgi:CBS domain-containing protein
MECPSCGHDNLPGADHCAECHTSLMQEDGLAALICTRVARCLSEDKVAKLNPVSVVSVPEETPLDVAVETMRSRKIGCLLITDPQGRLSGVFTERDLLRKVAVRVNDLSSRTVKEFMTQRPETVQADQPLASALRMMKVGDFRYLPLVDDEDRPKKIISSRDIIGYLTALTEETP